MTVWAVTNNPAVAARTSARLMQSYCYKDPATGYVVSSFRPRKDIGEDGDIAVEIFSDESWTGEFWRRKNGRWAERGTVGWEPMQASVPRPRHWPPVSKEMQ